MSDHDIVIAGAGHNSLVTATYLAKAEFSVLLIEARSVVGGDTATEDLTLPGLYQTGATTHPGGSVTAGPGRNAAIVLLEDLGSSLEAAIGAG
jgi:phytoene dehydrogenase-like protein